MKKCKDIISNELYELGVDNEECDLRTEPILNEIRKELMALPTDKFLDGKLGYVKVIRVSDIKEFFGL